MTLCRGVEAELQRVCWRAGEDRLSPKGTGAGLDRHRGSSACLQGGGASGLNVLPGSTPVLPSSGLSFRHTEGF